MYSVAIGCKVIANYHCRISLTLYILCIAMVVYFRVLILLHVQTGASATVADKSFTIGTLAEVSKSLQRITYMDILYHSAHLFLLGVGRSG